MNKNTTIVLVENNTAERDEFIRLAEAKNWMVQPFTSSYEAIQWLKKDNEAALMVIAEDATPLNAYQTFDYLRKELNSELPVAIATTVSNTASTEEYSFLEKPFTANSIKALKLVADSDSVPQNDKIYSLEYLETISGGNQEFLIDCLKTFISSVSGKMGELKIAADNRNLEDIGAIAHNIKPSFEMLENAVAKDICNKLTYEAETVDVQELASILNTEFEAMEDALKQDFPELR